MKLNNKGFAISVIVYSIGTIAVLTLLLILSVDSGIKKNTAALDDNVKTELNSLYRKEWTYSYVGDIQVFKVPTTGTYRIEAWGASGYSECSSCTGTNGRGAYSKLNSVTLSGNSKLYIVVGGEGDNFKGGYNGGGDGISSNGQLGYGGGGATHVATANGLLKDLVSNKSTVLIVAGGGGNGGTSGNGGVGGSTGGNGYDTYNNTGSNNLVGVGASTTSAGCTNTTSVGCGSFGQGGKASLYSGSYGGSGGGGGYFGGGGSARGHAGAGGGSSYLSGAGSMLSGADTIPDCIDNTKTKIGNSGNGFVKITKLS